MTRRLFNTHCAEAPLWFWLIVLFEMRVILVLLMGGIHHTDSGDFTLQQAALIAGVLQAIQALLMTGLYPLRCQWPGVLYVLRWLMVLSALVDIVFRRHGAVTVVHSGASGYLSVPEILINTVSILALTGSNQLRRVFPRHRYSGY